MPNKDPNIEFSQALSRFFASIEPSNFPETIGKRGIVVCGGGYKYFTNACILARMLSHLGCTLPKELWVLDKSEFNSQMQRLAENLGFCIRVAEKSKLLGNRNTQRLPSGARWQWALKPYSIIHSKFDNVFFIDADSFPTRDPSYLFDSNVFQDHGAIFWPDIRATSEQNPIWKLFDVPYRTEPELESGQMVIDKRRCWEPLQLALWMNQQADLFYNIIWGDKDTFRFAWHKYGRAFGIVPNHPQPMSFNGAGGVAGLWQHDFEGNWLFQHRNMAKWDLLGQNPRIPGYQFETESRQYLKELREQWNGRLLPPKPAVPDLTRSQKNKLQRFKEELVTGIWLFEDHRPKSIGCCAPAIEKSVSRISFPWQVTGPAVMSQSTRYMEMSFDPDAIGTGAQKDLYWWDIKPGPGEDRWSLHLVGEKGTSVSLRLQPDGSWSGKWKKEKGQKALSALLVRPAGVYPEGTYRNQPAKKLELEAPIHIANHAFGIGDAIVGLYAVMGIVKSGIPVIYHTRFPEWLSRVTVPGLTITSEPPPDGTCDLNADYDEQSRYGQSRASWYAMLAAAGDARLHSESGFDLKAAPPIKPARPTLNRGVIEPVLDLSKYVLLAPFAAWGMRDWSESHWRRLAYLLNEAGYEVLALGKKADEDRFKQTFDKSNAYWVLDQTPEWIMSAMLEAECVIGLDSGMVHLAGLLGVPTVCIHSHLPPKFLFNQAPSVLSVTPDTSCTFCRWQPDKGYNEGCKTSCSALVTVSPEAVLTAVQSPKVAVLRTKLVRAVERDSRRALKVGLPEKPARIEVVKQPQADIIAYTLPPDSGMGEAAAMNLEAFHACGLTVERREWRGTVEIEPALRDPNQIYYHHWHPFGQEAHWAWESARAQGAIGAKHIAYWAYEVEGEVPANFAALAPFMSEIWTPSHFCQGIFQQTGRPVRVVPHAVPAVESLAELPSLNGKAPFTVLYLFDGWSGAARKNPLAAVRVFQAAFPARHDVRLVLKGRHLTEAEVQETRTAFGFDSRITLMNQFLTTTELDNVFDRADALLSLQRSEGFGLNIAKALGRGLPVITTGWGGQLEFCNTKNSLLVPFQLEAVSKLAGHNFATGHWAAPDEDSAAELLQMAEQMTVSRSLKLAAMRKAGHSLIATEFSQAMLNARIANCMTAMRSDVTMAST